MFSEKRRFNTKKMDIDGFRQVLLGEDEDVLPGAQTISKLVYNQPMDTIVYT